MKAVQIFFGMAVMVGSSAGIFMALKPSETDRLWQENSALRQENRQLQESIGRLTLETRVAEVRVVDQIHEGDLVNGQPAEQTTTTLEFIEFDRMQRPLPPRKFIIEGDVVYFDSLVLKFDYEDVALGDALRGKSLLMFRRIFGEHQNPVDGYYLDPENDIPDVYRVDPDPSELERKLWSRFWDYMEDDKLRAQDGVRIVQIEAPAVKMSRGQVWVLTHQATGDLNLEERTPPSDREDRFSSVDSDAEPGV